MKDFIKNKLTEGLNDALNINEKNLMPQKPEASKAKEEKAKKTEDGGGSQYQKIQALLGTDEKAGNDLFNHSAVIRHIWGDSDDTKRSLFMKKLNMSTNDQGSKYMFDDEEITKISNYLMGAATDIRKSLGRSGKA